MASRIVRNLKVQESISSNQSTQRRRESNIPKREMLTRSHTHWLGMADDPVLMGMTPCVSKITPHSHNSSLEVTRIRGVGDVQRHHHHGSVLVTNTYHTNRQELNPVAPTTAIRRSKYQKSIKNIPDAFRRSAPVPEIEITDVTATDLGSQLIGSGEWDKIDSNLLSPNIEGFLEEGRGDGEEEVVEETPHERWLRVAKKWQKAIRMVTLQQKLVHLHKRVKHETKIFGRTTFFGDTNIRKKDHLACIILPESLFKLAWSASIALLLIFTAIYVPLRIAFFDEIPFGMYVTEFIIDGIFFIDIILNFFASYYDDDHNLIIDKKRLAKEYIFGWFFIDLIACFPFQLIMDAEGDYNKLLRLLRLGRLYRLLRMLNFLRLLKIMRNNKQYERILIMLKMHRGVKRLIKVIVSFFMIAHFFACAWFFAAKLVEFPPDCWVVRAGARDESPGNLYMISLYWVLTLTTVGYGEILPITNTERYLATFFMIVGVGFCTYAIGTISSILSSSDSSRKRLKEKLMALDELARGVDMTPDLYYKIKRAIKGNHETHFNLYMNQETLLEELPPSLRSIVVTLLYQKNKIDNVQFFHRKDPNFLIEILPCLKQISVDKDDFIYNDGDWADEMFFILKGTVSLATTDYFLIRSYIQGSYFGEAEILTKPGFREYSAVATEHCELLKIKKSDLLRILSNYEDIEEDLREVMLQRQSKNVESTKQAEAHGHILQPDKIEELKKETKSILHRDYNQRRIPGDVSPDNRWYRPKTESSEEDEPERQENPKIKVPKLKLIPSPLKFFPPPDQKGVVGMGDSGRERSNELEVIAQLEDEEEDDNQIDSDVMRISNNPRTSKIPKLILTQSSDEEEEKALIGNNMNINMRSDDHYTNKQKRAGYIRDKSRFTLESIKISPPEEEGDPPSEQWDSRRDETQLDIDDIYARGLRGDKDYEEGHLLTSQPMLARQLTHINQNIHTHNLELARILNHNTQVIAHLSHLFHNMQGEVYTLSRQIVVDSPRKGRKAVKTNLMGGGGRFRRTASVIDSMKWKDEIYKKRYNMSNQSTRKQFDT